MSDDSMENQQSAPGTGIDRRRFLKSGAAGVAFAALAGKANAMGMMPPQSADYGPLQLVDDETTGLPLIALPEGFRYKTFGWTNDPMDDGNPTPGSHDGMAVVATHGSQIVMVRNHERRTGALFSPEPAIYDHSTGGGTTNLVFDVARGEWRKSWGSLSGTVRNCAGGPTPWGTWLTCEETVAGPENGNASMAHGWVFEVPAHGFRPAQPLKGLGRFVHEAVAVDPATGVVYLTEDRGTSGFYRFVPNRYGRLDRGGKLQMLKVRGKPQLDLTGGFANGTSLGVEWVDIDDPELAHTPGTTDALGVFKQGYAKGGAVFERGEGCWYDAGRIYFVSTSGGAANEGQIWEYYPRTERLVLLFESPSREVLDSPDNIAVSPRGGIILCEDGGRDKQMLHGLTRDGSIFPFAENNVILSGEKGFTGNFTGSEWCGATFHGRWLFVNIQSPGITFAITGPWWRGAL